MSTDFSALLNTNVEDAERPKPLPIGHYDVTVDRYEMGKSAKKGTPFVRFYYKNPQPAEDVEPSLLEGVKLNRELRTEFYLTPDALYRLREFIEKLGLDVTGRNFNDLLPETSGLPIRIRVEQRPDERGENIYNDITGFVTV